MEKAHAVPVHFGKLAALGYMISMVSHETTPLKCDIFTITAFTC